MSLSQRSIGLVTIVILALGANQSTRAERHLGTDFNRVIQPILADNCFFCHGPDKQEGGLRLDLRELALEQGVFVEGGASELVARITSKNPDFRMPPPESNRKLRPVEIQALTEWVEERARYEKHWAWQPISEETLTLEPLDHGAEWGRNPIDAIVYRRMQVDGQSASRSASPERLLRRVAFDLTGMPPSIESMDLFLRDTSPGAYERVVDRLLASPRYGEHWARAWLDVSRYADTYGYDNDREMHVWPWRDWVVRAYNQNLSYDDFLRYQLAGDLLPNANADQRLATTFNRLHRQNAEGGVLPDEFLVEYVADRTQTFATAFMGVTLECARCHDHKFDPISQKEYYALTAYFNNIDEAGVYAEKTGAIPTPNMFLYALGQKERHEELLREVGAKEFRLEEMWADASRRYTDWKETHGATDVPVVSPLVQLDFESNDPIPGSARRIDGKRGEGVEFTGDEGVTLEKIGSFERTDPFSIGLWLQLEASEKRRVICHNSKPNWEAGHRGFELVLDELRIEFGLSHFWPGNAIRVRTKAALEPGAWHHVVVRYDGSSDVSGLSVFFNGMPAEVDILKDRLYSSIRFPGNPPPTILGARQSELGLVGDKVDEFRLFDVCLTALEIGRLANVGATPTEADLIEHYIRRIDPPFQRAVGDLRSAREKENRFVGSLRSIMVMEDRLRPAEARVLNRGSYDSPRERVSPAVPERISPSRDRRLGNRLDLCNWLLDRNHPLTARVAVNRIWTNFFGKGLVETVEDFGLQGARPTHPFLLDYLAKRLMDSGWNMKAMCRLIVTSETYRQEGLGEAQVLGGGSSPSLASGLRHRLSAEQIRDAALAAAGMLSLEIGGPSVKPVQPPGLWSETGPQKYKAGSGEALYRRSIYTFWKRTAPPPGMLTFDGVSRELCVSRRETTQTPLQSLVLLNDSQFLEAARGLADQGLMHDLAISDAVTEVFRRLVSRFPSKEERDELLNYLEEQRDWFSRNPSAAGQYLEVGDWPASAEHDEIEWASLMAVTQLVMNFHDFQMK